MELLGLEFSPSCACFGDQLVRYDLWLDLTAEKYGYPVCEVRWSTLASV
jgi:hypothetical protein